MNTAMRRRTTAAWTVSALAHVVVLAVLAAHAPVLRIPYEPAGPPEPIIPILLLPRTPPPPPGSSERPAPIRLHRRQLRPLPPELPVTPLVAPVEKAAPAPERPAPPPAQPQPEAMSATARVVLKGLVGCANPSTLTKTEREACEQKLAAGVKTAPSYGLGLGADAAAALDRTADHKAACRAYRGSTTVAQPRLRDGLC